MLPLLAATALLPSLGDDEVGRGLQVMDTILREFRTEGVPGYAEAIEEGKPRRPVFNWGLGVLLSAMNAAARADAAWKTHLRGLIEASRSYWNPAGPVPGFDVLPMPKSPDRYYDDNAWLVLALVESYEVLGERECLKLAEDALTFVLSGWDDRMGGGIYWRESDKKSKNTCSNAPAAAACLAVYEKTKRTELLEKAKGLYAWTKKHLQDPEDLLFWDNVSVRGAVEKTKWSYNTALMIRSAAMLANATGDRRYASEAEEMATASEKQWFVNGRIADVGRFAHLLLESWNHVPSESRKAKARQALEWLWKHGRNQHGLFGPRFDEAPSRDRKRFELIDQASAARAFFVCP